MSLFDSEQRVVFANRRFAEIYGLAPEEVRPGTTLRQILTARRRKRRLQQHRCRQVRRRGCRQLPPGGVAHPAPGRRPVHLRRAPTHGRRRPGQHARGCHGAREAQRAPGRAERSLAPAGGGAQGAKRALRHGIEKHVARPLHVRRRAARPDSQSALCRDLWADARPGEARHDPAADCRVSYCPRALRWRHPRGLPQGASGKIRRCIGRGAPPQRRPRHLRPPPADARRRLGLDARGHHRAPEAASAARAAEYAARRGHEQHVAGPGHVRRRAAARRLQQALRGDLRLDARASAARHHGARDLAASRRQRLLLGRRAATVGGPSARQLREDHKPTCIRSATGASSRSPHG